MVLQTLSCLMDLVLKAGLARVIRHACGIFPVKARGAQPIMFARKPPHSLYTQITERVRSDLSRDFLYRVVVGNQLFRIVDICTVVAGGKKRRSGSSISVP